MIAAIKALPDYSPDGKTKVDLTFDRLLYQHGYEQAEKDTIERACDMLMNYVFEEVTPEMRDHFRKRLEGE